ncbi:MAG: hypothetical protein F6K28_57895 [Microcoleus sp. SIO2G3]|nr:hypothetical protein [Microcoleus sp. SIO2G3]
MQLSFGQFQRTVGVTKITPIARRNHGDNRVGITSQMERAIDTNNRVPDSSPRSIPSVSHPPAENNPC